MSNFNIQVGLGPPIPPSDAYEHYLWGVYRVKRFVSVYLHSSSAIEKDEQNVDVALPGKYFCRRPWHQGLYWRGEL